MSGIGALEVPSEMMEKIAMLYGDMEQAYDQVAGAIGLSCAGCPDNCCDSYFCHFTYVEWLYLREGLQRVDADTAKAIEQRAVRAVSDIERQLARGSRPQVMCPLNSDGRCLLYAHRLMICRLHGVPARVSQRGQQDMFPGCFRCQETKTSQEFLDRTPFYQQLAMLERELLAAQSAPLARVRLTIAQMIVLC